MHITTIHPAAGADLDLVETLIANARATGDDSGRALLDLFGDRDDQPEFSTQSFRAGSLSGEWVAARGTGSAGVMLYLHGRRFQHHEPAGVLAGRLSAVSGLPVLLPYYRLAPQHPYPAALDDTLAAYQALLDLGIPADRIVIVGHSAGATLVLSALIALRDSGRPMPACAAAISPITDFTLGSASLRDDEGRDVVTLAEVTAVRDAYLGTADPAGAPQSPLAGDCTGLPPLLIGCGGAELLRDDATRFSKHAAADGAEVDVEVYAGMPHGFPVMPTEAASAVLERIAAFSASHLAGGASDPTIRPLSIRRIGWAGYEICTEHGTRVLVDPYLCGSEGLHHGIPESPIKPAELFGVDVVAVTHAGFDHRGQALEIAAAGKATLICGSAMFQAALRAGVPPQRVSPMVSGVEFRFRDVTIKSLPARHESTMTMDGQFVADQPQSYLVTTAEGARIFCGGDNSLSEDLLTWGALYEPQVAVLGIGGLWVGPVHVVELPPAEAATAARWLGVSTVIPVHYQPGDPAPTQLAADLAAQDTRIEVAVLDFGDTWTAA